MNGRLTVAMCVTAVLGASLAVGTAAAQAPRNTITIVGGVKFNPGESVEDNQRFTARVVTVRSGATVRVRNRGRTQDPHTLSLVRKGQLPTGFDPQGCPACGPLMEAHQANQETGEVGVPLVNVGAEGFDRPGDSQFIPPRQGISFHVTAPRGRELYYFCVVHPWMQGEIRVR